MSIEWRQSLPLLAAAALITWRIGVSGLAMDNLLALRVIHEVVSASSYIKAPGYRSEVRQALGFIPAGVSAPRDAELMAQLEQRSTSSVRSWRIAASYALLSTSGDDPAAAVARMAVPDSPDTDPVTAIWRGRVAWARGAKSGAGRAWRVALGPRAVDRKKLAEALYVSGEYLFAIDEAIDLLSVADCDASCRAETWELLRYWVVWQGRSDEGARAMCDRMLEGVKAVPRDATMDPGLANILGRRARTYGGATIQADADLARAEAIENTPYVRAVRADFALRAGRRDAAHRGALAALRDAGRDAHALIMAGETLRALGDRAEARRAWSWAAERDPLLASIAQSLLDVYK